MRLRSSCTLMIAAFLALVTASASSQPTVQASKDAIIRAAVRSFTAALKNDDPVSFRKLIHPAGLIVIRNFVTGGYGARGKDIRDTYPPSRIPGSLEFPVAGEIPVRPRELFAATINGDVAKIPLETTDGKNTFQFQGRIPSTTRVIEICGRIQTLDKKTGLKPRLFALGGREFALTESEMISGLSLGSWAVFEKASDCYYLRAIMDFR